MTDRRREEAWSALMYRDTETALRLLTDYHGMRLIDGGFAGFLEDEGILEPEDDGEGAR